MDMKNKKYKNSPVMEKVRNNSMIAGALILLIVLAIISMCSGRYHLTAVECIQILFSRLFHLSQAGTSEVEVVLFKVRLPRIISAVMVGGSLAISGTVYQGIFKNPLVSPDLLGVSSGASVGAACVILLGGGALIIQSGAFMGGIAAVLLTSLVPKLMRNYSTMTLVLAGIIVQGFMSAVLGMLKYIADPESELAEITYWQMGSLANATSSDVLTILPAVIIAMAVLLMLRWQVNLLSLGDGEARALGVNVRLIRGITVVCSTVLTACSVCISGVVGWVGLIVPHICRLLSGADNTITLPLSVLVGADFMLFIDTVARTISSSEIPLSILTGFVGAPVYAWLLVKQRMKVK